MMTDDEKPEEDAAIYCYLFDYISNDPRWVSRPGKIHPFGRYDHLIVLDGAPFFTRLMAQQGMFTVHPYPFKQLLDNSKYHIDKMIIRKEYIRSLRLHLYKAGFHRVTLFPDLDGAALSATYFDRVRLGPDYFD